MTKAFINEIPGRHKSNFVSEEDVHNIDLDLDWAFRQIEGPIDEEVIRIAEEMLRLVHRKEVWRDLGGESHLERDACNALETFIAAGGFEDSSRERRG